MIKNEGVMRNLNLNYVWFWLEFDYLIFKKVKLLYYKLFQIYFKGNFNDI